MNAGQINVTLTPQGAKLLRAMRERRPGLSPAEIVEEALSEQVARQAYAPKPFGSRAEIRAWYGRPGCVPARRYLAR